jgi:hypothetical protein
MKKKLAVSSLLCIILLGSCLQPGLPNRAPAEGDQQKVCVKLTLPSTAPLNPSWTWFEITVGESSSEDLISKYGEPLTKRFFPVGGEPAGCIYQYSLDGHTVFFYIVDGRVYAIEIPAPSYLFGNDAIFTLVDVVGMYGRPELVGFNTPYGSGYRTLVWPVEGVQAFVSLGLELSAERPPLIDISRADIVSLVYSSPTSVEEYQESFLSIWFHETRPESDVFEVYPQDPFDWE